MYYKKNINTKKDKPVYSVNKGMYKTTECVNFKF